MIIYYYCRLLATALGPWQKMGKCTWLYGKVQIILFIDMNDYKYNKAVSGVSEVIYCVKKSAANPNQTKANQ